MIAELLARLGSAGTIAVGAIGIFVDLRNQHRQLNAQMYIEFSARFQELLRSFPTDAWLANADPSQPMPAPTKEVTECRLYAIQFLADIYYLHKGGYLSANLWKLWERAIKKTLGGRVFRLDTLDRVRLQPGFRGLYKHDDALHTVAADESGRLACARRHYAPVPAAP